MIDCGCNFGFYSFFSASLSKKNFVIAIEASSSTIEEFKINLSLNDLNNIKLVNKAVTDKDNEIVKFNLSNNDWESSVLKSNFDIKETLTTQSITIDKLIKKDLVGNKKLIIKIDVEGYDFNVLEGARKTIEIFSPLIIIEFSKYIIANKKFNYDYLENFLKLYEYEIYSLKGEPKTVNQILNLIKKLGKNHQTIGNYYLLKKNSNFKQYLIR